MAAKQKRGQKPSLKAQLQEARAQLEEQTRLLKRVQADFENYIKRVERRQQEARHEAEAALVQDLLPVLDALDAACASSPSRKGLEGLRSQLFAILVSRGLGEVDASGDFDPRVHACVHRSQKPGHRDGAILEVYQKGYTFKGRLLRPAKVAVNERAKQKR